METQRNGLQKRSFELLTVSTESMWVSFPCPRIAKNGNGMSELFVQTQNARRLIYIQRENQMLKQETCSRILHLKHFIIPYKATLNMSRKLSYSRSNWTYLTASPCYTTNTTTTIPQTDIMNKQFINADTQSSNKCAQISEINKFLFMDIQITTIKLLGKHVIQTNPSKFDERLFSGIHFVGGGGGGGGAGGGER